MTGSGGVEAYNEPTGTIVDATILHAPSSTRNASGKRDQEMHQTRKGKQWYFGLKAHIGVDAKEGTVHSVCTTAASVADCHMLPELLHGEERKVWGGRRLPGPDRGDQRSRTEGPGHDLQANEVQEVCGRVTEKEEHQ
jgi:IS5 family transposase